MATPKRYSGWQMTLPFALNNDFYTQPAVTQYFALPKTWVVPVLSEFHPAGSDPSGWRHTTLHPAWLKCVASGTGPTTLAFQGINFQATDISRGIGVSKTKTFLFRIHKFNNPGITRVVGMRLWASDLNEFLTPETVKVIYKLSTPWLSGFAFSASELTNRSRWMPTSLPDYQNLWRTDGKLTIHGSGDADVSQWIYVAVAASGTTPLGEYGDMHAVSGFNIRVTFDVDNLYSLFD